MSVSTLAPVATSPAGERLPLAKFQGDAVEGLQATVRRVAEYHAEHPQNRREIALSCGVMLLQSPTGSGKTLILGRTLEGLKGKLPAKCIWFWFAPYSGLVAQTRDALAEQCGSLRLRDVYTDREVAGSRDGDVFVQTWAAVSAQHAEARKVRRSTERVLSLDDMIAELRGDGFLVGVVIDEAHLNFGASATAAARFYLDTLQPDVTLLATATPNDDKLADFERQARIEVASRVVIERGQVVQARLNKRGLMLGVLRFQAEDTALIDLEQATLTAAWSQHGAIKERLAEEGVGLVPLMLVQVEDQAAGGEDPVARVKEKLEQAGVPGGAIKSHTSGEPDPEFHTLSYDPSVEVLIFKVAVATGFDAPRAWTLVSVRPNRGREFGMQIVGRIMRVHPSVRARAKTDPLLDRGYVFLTDPDIQAGLSAAVAELKAVRHSIELLTDRLDVVEFGNARTPLTPDSASVAPPPPAPPSTPAERHQRLFSLIEAGYLRPAVAELTPAEQDRAIVHGEALADLGGTPLFGALPEQPAPTSASTSDGPRRARTYTLRAELGLPAALIREELPDIHQIAGDLTRDIAREFCKVVDLRGELTRRRRRAVLDLRDLFEGDQESRSVSVRVSNARIAQSAQLAFQFNDAIDPRQLKRELVQEFQRICDDDGTEYTSDDLRRAVDVAAMRRPESLREAMRAALRGHMQLLRDQEIPSREYWTDGLKPAAKGAYGVLPPTMNNEERAFAEFLDADRSGTVKWWLRNPENARWATRLVLPNGKRFFPDFVVGVANRSTPDSIALVEIKDDGVTGRLQSSSNIMKIRVQHQEYRNAFWSYRENGVWARATFNEGLHRIIPIGAFSLSDMVYLG